VDYIILIDLDFQLLQKTPPQQNNKNTCCWGTFWVLVKPWKTACSHVIRFFNTHAVLSVCFQSDQVFTCPLGQIRKGINHCYNSILRYILILNHSPALVQSVRMFKYPNILKSEEILCYWISKCWSDFVFEITVQALLLYGWVIGLPWGRNTGG